MEYRVSFGKIRLYLDDLDDIYAILASRVEKISISAHNAVADRPIDLRDATRNELDNVSFITKNPDVVVALMRNAAFARTTDDSDNAHAILNEVQSLLAARGARYGRLAKFFSDLQRTLIISLTSLILLVLLLMSASFVIGQSPREFLTDLWRNAPTIVGFVLGYPLVQASVWTLFSKNSVKINPQRRGSARHASAQTRNAWVVGMVTVALSIVGTALVTYLLVRP